MKPNVFTYSVLTVGIVAVMGSTGIAHAAGPDATTTDDVFSVVNQATASYKVEGNAAQQTATSNKVTVKVSETASFTLGTSNGDVNANFTINPQAGETVSFTHTLANTGNVADTYTISLGNEIGDDFDYNTTDSTITYQIKTAAGVDVGVPVTIANDGKITLESLQKAVITITAKADGKRVIDANGILKVTATSAFFTNKAVALASAVNTNNAKTTTPVYAITNSAITNLGTKNFNVTNDKSYVDYTVTVKNEGNIDGSAVTIMQTLPDGLTFTQVSDNEIYAAPVIKRDGSPIAITPSMVGKEIKFEGVDIGKEDVITITFRAKKDTTTPASGTKITTYAIVKDDVNGDGTFDLIDSSGDTGHIGANENVYESTSGDLTNKGTDDNTQATITTSSQTRKLDISTGVNKEVALVSNNIYTYTITNNGTDINEATAAGQTYFTVVPTTPHEKVNIERVFVDVNKNGGYDEGGDILLTKVVSTENYDLKDATVDGLIPDEAVTIGVEVSTAGTGSNDGVNNNNLGQFETMTISVLPQGSINGTPQPLNVTTTSTTTMQGINLQKFQLTADCGTAVSGLNWTNTEITAAAGQCIFYKLEATNTFTANNITDVIIKETLTPNVTYQNDFASNTDKESAAATGSYATGTVTGTYLKLIPKEKGTITFSAKVSQTGTNK